jgi:hypothetical protein
VWLVAIESHTGRDGAPSDLDIAAPVAETALDVAAHFASMQDVSVRMNIAHSGRHEERLKQLQAHPRLTIADACLQELSRSINEARGYDCVVMYWVGHGVQDGNDRLLLAQDSRSQNDTETLDFSSVLAYWRDAAFPPLQIGFVDTCAQSLKPSSRKTFEGGAASREQHFIFSASAGEFASTLGEQNPFPRVVLDALKEAGWPVKGRDLIDAIADRLEETPGNSRTTVWRTIGSGDTWAQLTATPQSRELRSQARRAQVSLGEMQHLFEAAGGAASPAELANALMQGRQDELVEALGARPGALDAAQDLAFAFERFRIGQRMQQPLRDLGLRDAMLRELAVDVLRFADRPAKLESDDIEGVALQVLDLVQTDRGIQAFLRLLLQAARLAAVQRPKEARKLRDLLEGEDWSKAHVAQVEKDLPADGPFHLQVSVRLDAAKVCAVIEDAWLHDGLRHQHLEVPDDKLPFSYQLSALIESASRPPHGVVVELLLPNALLCMPKSWLQTTNQALGTTSCVEANWPVIVRWKDRLIPANATDYNAARWKTRSEALRKKLIGNPQLICSPPANSDDAHFRLLGKKGPAPHERAPRPEFFEVLLEGHPFISWPRVAVPDEKAWIEEVRAVIEKQSIDNIPQMIQRRKKPDDSLSELVLMIDEPRRNPFE